MTNTIIKFNTIRVSIFLVYDENCVIISGSFIQFSLAVWYKMPSSQMCFNIENTINKSLLINFTYFFLSFLNIPSFPKQITNICANIEPKFWLNK